MHLLFVVIKNGKKPGSTIARKKAWTRLKSQNGLKALLEWKNVLRPIKL